MVAQPIIFNHCPCSTIVFHKQGLKKIIPVFKIMDSSFVHTRPRLCLKMSKRKKLRSYYI